MAEDMALPTATGLRIRCARPDELEWILELEELAGRRYADAGLPTDLDGLPLEVAVRAQSDGLLWVSEADERVVGFALCWRCGDALHLRELDVHPEWMGRGLGKALVEHVATEAARRGCRWVTLTTFREVAWNAPLYLRWGFVELDVAEMPSWLSAIREDEDAGELGRWPRVAMARVLAPIG